jgi:hypothetical protein
MTADVTNKGAIALTIESVIADVEANIRLAAAEAELYRLDRED